MPLPWNDADITERVRLPEHVLRTHATCDELCSSHGECWPEESRACPLLRAGAATCDAAWDIAQALAREPDARAARFTLCKECEDTLDALRGGAVLVLAEPASLGTRRASCDLCGAEWLNADLADALVVAVPSALHEALADVALEKEEAR